MPLIELIETLFSIYIILIAIRIIGSWFPALSSTTIMQFIKRLVDPYLGLFQRLIPPIGGVLDLSPMLAYFTLTLLKFLLIKGIVTFL